MKDEKTGFYLWDYGTRPAALPKEESARLLREYHKYGDKEIREKLIYGQLGLVQKLVGKYCKKYVEFEDQINPSFEDLLEIGTEVLIKSIDEFDPDKFKFLFSTYYSHQLRSKISHIYRGQHSVRTKKSLDALLKDKSGDDSKTNQGDRIPSTMREFDVLHDKLELQYIQKEILPLLSRYERDLFVAKFFQNKTQGKIAEQFKSPQPCISRDIKEVQKKVLRMYLEGPTALDKELKGIKLNGTNLQFLEENAKLFEKYGREFLRQYFLPTLSPAEQKIFDATVLNYRGQSFAEIAEIVGMNETHASKCRGIALKKLEQNVKKLKQMQAEGKLPKPWKPTLKQTQEINRNERYIEQFGGRFFLQKYFVPTLTQVQKKIFIFGVLQFEGQPKKELAEKAGVSQTHFATTLKTVKEKLAATNFETLVDFLDNKNMLKNGENVDIAERKIDFDQVERRRQIVKQYGGKEKLAKYFLPILPEKQRETFDLLYIKQSIATYSAAAEYLHTEPTFIVAQEKILLKKLESTNFEELEKIDKMAEEYLSKSRGQLLSSKKNSLRQKVLSEYGGVAFLREVFLPQIITNADREIFEGVVLEGQPMKNFAHLFSYERKYRSSSYFDQVDIQTKITRIRQRLNNEILPKLETFKANFEDFDKAVKDFYVKRGFEQIHPEDFEKMAFEEVEKITTLSRKRERKPFITPELVEKAGGEKVLMRKFRPTLCLSHQMILMKAYADKMTDSQIAEDMQLSLSNIGHAKETIVEKLEAFAEKKSQSKSKTKTK